MKYFIATTSCSGASEFSRVLFNLLSQWVGCKNDIKSISSGDPEYIKFFNGVGFVYINGTIHRAYPSKPGSVHRMLYTSPNHLYSYTILEKHELPYITSLAEHISATPIVLIQSDIEFNALNILKELNKNQEKFECIDRHLQTAETFLTQSDPTRFYYGENEIRINIDDFYDLGGDEHAIIKLLGLPQQDFVPTHPAIRPKVSSSMFTNKPLWDSRSTPMIKRILDFKKRECYNTTIN